MTRLILRGKQSHTLTYLLTLRGKLDEGGALKDIQGADISTEPALYICMHMRSSSKNKDQKGRFQKFTAA